MRITFFLTLLLISFYTQAQDETTQCLKGLNNDARFISLKTHLPLDGTFAHRPAMLADKTIPDENQKRAIADWIDARSVCVNLSPVKVTVDLNMVFLSIVPDLYNGSSTFGEFNSKWRDLYQEVSKASPEPQPATHQH